MTIRNLTSKWFSVRLTITLFVFLFLAISVLLPQQAAAQEGRALTVENVTGEIEAVYTFWGVREDGTKYVIATGKVHQGMTLPAQCTISVPDGTTVVLVDPEDPSVQITLEGPVDYNVWSGEQVEYSGDADTPELPPEVPVTDVDIDQTTSPNA
ncbi:MAG: hypothetical protein A3G87_05860 [Omnitrophica bacterium RIFCSPLOWO2_12_FULL_50_11]|nr:MAG: hypothetical protein A3G87_05860 [Omnitrophica bacterium RIFCSPLOWO2_12_FULL_50_11]